MGFVSTRLRSTCERCGTVETPMGDAELVLELGGGTPESGNIVRFQCPKCLLACTDTVNGRGARLLLAAGIQVVVPTARPSEVPAGYAPSAGGTKRA